MLQDGHERINPCEQAAAGPTIVFVAGPGSRHTIWRGMIAALGGRFQTMIPGVPEPDSGRESYEVAIDRYAGITEAMLRRTGRPVHLVGHAHGALVSLDIARCGLAPLMSLTLIEPAMPLPDPSALANILLPSIVVLGEHDAPALRHQAEALSRAMANASLRTITAAGDVMKASRDAELAELVGRHVRSVESLAWTSAFMDPGLPSLPRARPG